MICNINNFLIKNRKNIRKQMNIYQHSRNGYALNSNDLPDDKTDPLNDRILSYILVTKNENDIVDMSQTQDISEMDPNLYNKRNNFKNLLRLQQVVIYTYLIYCTVGMFGNKLPFTTQITDLLCKNILYEFSKVFKTYTFGPRDIKRLNNSVLHSALQRAFSELFLVENSKYAYIEENKKIIDREENKPIKMEEVCYEMHKRAYTTANDFVMGLTKTNSSRCYEAWRKRLYRKTI